MATLTTHPLRHRTGTYAAFRASAFRAWLYTPLFDVIVSLIAYLLLPQEVSRHVLVLLLGVSALAWMSSAARLSALRQPAVGFPNGVPSRMRHRLARLVGVNIAILAVSGTLLLLPSVTTAVCILAALSLLRAMVVGSRIFSYHPAK